MDDTSLNFPGTTLNPSGGCGKQALFVLTVIGILAASATAQFLFWLVDELAFEGTPVGSLLLRPIILVGYAISLLIPSALLTSWIKSSSEQPIYRTWLAASFFVLLMTPVRLLGGLDSQGAAVVQIAVMAIYSLGLLRFTRRGGQMDREVSSAPDRKTLRLGLLVGMLLGIPWLAWGAMGSPLDIFLNIITGLLFGASAGLTLSQLLFRRWKEDKVSIRGHIGLGGFSAVITLLIMTIGLEYTGFQWYLLMAIPLTGWLVAGLTGLAEQEQDSGRDAAGVLIGLAAVFPMMLIDPKELSLVVGSGPGEIISWVTRAGIVTIACEIVLSVALSLTLPRLAAWKPRLMLNGGIVVAGIAAALVYVILGRPGFFGERIFVILKDQPDVSSAAGMKNYDERRQYVYHTLTQQANASQARVRSILDRFGFNYTPYYLENGIEVEAGPLLTLWMLQQPEVDRVLNSPHLRPLPAPLPTARGSQPAPQGTLWNQTLIGADRVWNELGITGKGIVIGQSDSGVDGAHPQLVDEYRGRLSGSNYNWFDPWYHTAQPTDLGGHGTHTLGIALGKTVGIAPGATWFACVNLARNLGNSPLYLDCMQFMLAPFPLGGNPFTDGDPTRSANVMNNSWGCPPQEGCDPEALRPAVDALTAAGIFVEASAGNNGLIGCGSVSDPPGIYNQVYSVGAIDQQRDLADFSSLGPVTVDGSDRVKPDTVAPGVDVLSAFPQNTYQIDSGTSMSGPHVVGVVALMWSANPTLIGDIEMTRKILDETTQPYPGTLPSCVNGSQKPNDGVGWGIVDAYAAVKLAIQEK